MDASSPEFIAARAVATFALERFIRERSNWIVTLASVITLLLFVGAWQSDGLGAVVLGLFTLVAASVTATLFVVRWTVVRGIRRVGGGRDYARVKPIVERHIDDVERAQGSLKFDNTGLFKLLWKVRRPGALKQHVQTTANTLVQAAPRVVDDVRRELGR